MLDGKSRGVFTGRIFVHRIAQKTDAKQSNDNLLLSESAHVNTKPQLEIFADAVRCTHGATIGQVDEEALFYLRSRGFPLEAARSLLIYAFAGEALGQITIEALRNQVQQAILERLPHGALLGAESPLFYDHDFVKHIKSVDRRRESY
jgi:Fe-S cluster assembly protein SufD